MRIYSWNALFSNKELPRAASFIQEAPWDIFCLQEVSEDFLAQLKQLPCSIAYATEADRNFKGKRSSQYIVILSRHPIQGEGALSLPLHEGQLLVRSKIFVWVMFHLGLWARSVDNRNSVYADIEMPGGLMRVFSLHLPLLNPKHRAEELALALDRRESIPSIICGDFNVLESFKVTLLNWIFGGSLADWFSIRRERRNMEKTFALHGLKNPLLGRTTHPFSRSQLDHILVPVSAKITAVGVSKDRYGSDHCPVWVDCEI